MKELPDDQNSGDRRKDIFRFERSISLGTVISLLVLLFSIISAYSSIVSRIDHYERAAVKSDIMWEHWIREHQDISSSDWEKVR
jgi:hypothetical protein